MEQYGGNFAHGPGWWAVYLTLMICAVLAMMGLFLLGVTRSYSRQPAVGRAAGATRESLDTASAGGAVAPSPAGDALDTPTGDRHDAAVAS